jgi:4-amino-4-deoxy-L-arabinose transferase-like glycosyltransferase
MAQKTTLGILFALVAVHITLAAWFASVTPFRTAGVLLGMRDPQTGNPQKVVDLGAPDERQHVNYVAHLVHSGSFPVFNPKDPNLGETYQSHQPPLFYILESGWSILTGVDLPPTPPATEGKTMSQGDGIKMRALNVIIGALGVGAVFVLVVWGFGDEKAALLASAFVAFIPMNAALSGAVSNDPLLFLLCTLTLALAAKALREGWTVKLAFTAGLLAGLAILTKTTGVALLPVLFLAAFLPRERRPSFAEIGAAVVPILVLVGPWWIRNLNLYGDPLALKAFSEAFVNSAQAKTFIDLYGSTSYWVDWVGAYTARSFIGVFGYMDIWLTNTGSRSGANSIYQVAWLLIGSAFVGYLVALRGIAELSVRRVHILSGAMLVIIIILFLRFNSQYFQGQARYLYPAIGPIAAGVGIGFAKIFRVRFAVGLALIIFVFGIGDIFALTRLPEAFQKRIEIAKALP